MSAVTIVRAVAVVLVLSAACGNAADAPAPADSAPASPPSASPTPGASTEVTGQAVGPAGALLVEAGGSARSRLGGGDVCAALERALQSRVVRSCAPAAATGDRRFVGVHHAADRGDNAESEISIYAVSLGEAVEALATGSMRVWPPGAGEEIADYYDVGVRAEDVGGRPVLVVRYDPASASAPPSQFDVVVWEEADPAPSVAVHAGGERAADMRVQGDALVVTHPDYSDGSPGCCPKQGMIRTIRRAGPGRWLEQVQRVPIEQITGGPPPQD